MKIMSAKDTGKHIGGQNTKNVAQTQNIHNTARPGVNNTSCL